MIEKAKLIARQAHQGQFDKAGKEYIHHPEALANMVDTEEEKVVAWLHDVLEDSDIKEADLRAEFPDLIVDAVIALTRQDDERYVEYLYRVSKNPLAVVVKLADLEHNSDLSRFDEPSDRDIARSNRYMERMTFFQSIIE